MSSCANANNAMALPVYVTMPLKLVRCYAQHSQSAKRMSARMAVCHLPRQSEVFVIQVDEAAPFFRYVILGEDRDYGTHRLAGGAVDALIGMNEVLVVLIFSVDAVHRTDVHAGAVLKVNTRLGYDIGHLYYILLLYRC